MNRQSWPWWRWAMTGLSALALALSAYLSWHYLSGKSVIGCGGGDPCDQVLSSRWSAVGPLPVSGLAAGAYLAMLIASLFIGTSTEASVRRLAWISMLVLGGAVAGGAVWFVIVQKWIVHAFCPYCMATHVTGVLLAILIIWWAPKSLHDPAANPVSSDEAKVRNTFSSTGRLWPLPGLVLAGIMAICQVSFAPPPVSHSGESENRVTVMDPRSIPMVGSPDAPYIVSLLFDYNCPHCQQLHFMLNEVVRRYGGKLAFALCPTPLNTQCNPYVPRDVDEFKTSCELAKMGLAVWLADRKAFPEFELWMFSMESGDRWHPRSIDTTRAKAVELVGEAKFQAALNDPWVDQYLQSSVKLYGNSGNTALPKFVFGSHWVIPKPSDADELITILEQSLAVPAPQ